MSSHGCAVSCRAHAAVRDHRERRGGSRNLLPRRAASCESDCTSAMRLLLTLATRNSATCEATLLQPSSRSRSLQSTNCLNPRNSRLIRAPHPSAQKDGGSRTPVGSRLPQTISIEQNAGACSYERGCQRLVRDPRALFLRLVARVEVRLRRVLPLRVRPVLARRAERFRAPPRPPELLREPLRSARDPELRPRVELRRTVARDDRRPAALLRFRPEARPLRAPARVPVFFLPRLPPRDFAAPARPLAGGISSSRSRSLSNSPP
jgi:hypothetical protein